MRGLDKFYVSHKFTMMDGGAQDNQYQDLKQFLECAHANVDPHVFFLAVCDGAYYDRRSSVAKDLTRRAYLDNYVAGRQSRAWSSSELGTFLLSDQRLI